MTPATLTNCHAHLERVKAKIETIQLEPCDFATRQLADAIESIAIVVAALVESAPKEPA